MADVIDITDKRVVAKGEPDPEIIKMLRAMLADAEQGKIVAFAAVYCHAECHHVHDCWADGGLAPHALIGGLEFLKATLINLEVVERKFE